MNVISKPMLVMTGLLLALPATSLIADGHGKNIKRAIYSVDVRQSVLTVMGSNMGPMGAMARGKIPLNVALVEKNATRIMHLSEMLPDAFRFDTTGYDVTTDALDPIWDDFAKFEEKAKATNEAARVLAKVAASGDESAVTKAIGRLGKSCGSCHDDYKAEDS